MDDQEKYEIIEPEAPDEKPKRKLKRKYRPFFGHMPWRLLALAFSAGISVTIIAVIGYALLKPPPPEVVPEPTLSVTLPVPFPTALPTSFPENPPLSVTALPQDFIRNASWTGDSVAVISAMQLKSYSDFDSTPTFVRFDLNSPLTQAVVSPDKKRIAVFYDYVQPNMPVSNRLAILDGTTGALQKDLDQMSYNISTVYYGNITNVLAWSADSRLLAAATPDGRLTLWDMQTQKALAELQTDTVLSAIALKFTPDQHLMAITRYADTSIGRFDHDELRIWGISDPAKPALKKTFTLDNVYLMQAQFSEDGRYMALLGQVPYIEIVDTETGHMTGKIEIDADTMPISLGLNASGDTIALVYRQYNNPVPAATPVPGQPAGDRVELRVARWKFDSGGQFVSETVASRSDYLSLAGLDYLHFSGDNQSLSYISLADNKLYRWNIQTGEIRPAGYQ